MGFGGRINVQKLKKVSYYPNLLLVSVTKTLLVAKNRLKNSIQAT